MNEITTTNNPKEENGTYHICNFIFFPSSSIVLILKSIPVKRKESHTWYDQTKNNINTSHSLVFVEFKTLKKNGCYSVSV